MPASFIVWDPWEWGPRSRCPEWTLKKHSWFFSYVSMVSALCPCLSDSEFYGSMTTDLPLPSLDDEKRIFMKESERSRNKPRG